MKKLVLLIAVCILCFSFGCEEAAKALSTTISGNISNDGSPVTGAIVVLLDYEASGTIPTGLSLANGSITGANGNYVVIEVEIGDYMLVAIDDVDGSLTYTTGDRIGYYGTPDPLYPGFTVPTEISIVEEGEDVEDIDITSLYSLPIN